MKTNLKKWSKLLAVLLVLSMLFSAAATGASAASAPTSATTFTFTNSGVTASGATDGYKIEGTDLTINAAGVYTLTGSCSEGSVKVKKGTTGVTLILSGLTLSCSTTAPLSCNKTTETTLYLLGTNTLTDKESLANEDSDDFEGAAIKVKSESTLTIQGTGSLTADGSACKNGVKGASQAAITLESGTLTVKAANNGLASDGEVIVKGGTLNVTASNDGVKSEPDDDDTDSKGQVTISGGSVTINAQGDGIQATNNVTISGGTFNITTFGGYSNAKKLGTDDSAKGIKSSAGTVAISGGTFTLNTADDAIHSNGDVTLTGGTYNIKTGDDGIHADYNVTLGTKNASAGPSVTITNSYEGIEGATVTLNSGSGDVTASDDGINAATDASVSLIAITVNGGTWKVNAGGDGLDAGGDSRNNSGGYIYLNGGTVEVFGASDNGNSALDFDTACEANGGTLIAVGMSGMAQAPTKGVSVVFSNVSISSGKTIAVKDSSGNTLYSATGKKNANHVVFTSSAVTSGQSYTLYVNGSAAATATAGTNQGQAGMQPGGQQGGGMGPGGQQGGGMGPGGQQGGGMGPGGQNGQQPPEMPDENGEAPEFPGQEEDLPELPQEEEDDEEEEEADAPTPFTDVKPGTWYAPAVTYVYENKIMNGVSANSFSPLTNLTRGMMAQILYNMEGRPAVDGDSSFTDVQSGVWYSNAVEWAKESGIVSGYGDGTFGVNDAITRAQAATILKNYADLKGEDTAAGAATQFNDASAIPSWAQQAMGWCADTGILQGSGGSVNPNSTATRAEIAAIMQRYLTK